MNMHNVCAQKAGPLGQGWELQDSTRPHSPAQRAAAVLAPIYSVRLHGPGSSSFATQAHFSDFPADGVLGFVSTE